jgi:hypothetical protein
VISLQLTKSTTVAKSSHPTLVFVVVCRSFLILEKRGRSNTCVTTHELNALNSRLRDAASDCIMLTVQVSTHRNTKNAYWCVC